MSTYLRQWTQQKGERCASALNLPCGRDLRSRRGLHFRPVTGGSAERLRSNNNIKLLTCYYSSLSLISNKAPLTSQLSARRRSCNDNRILPWGCDIFSSHIWPCIRIPKATYAKSCKNQLRPPHFPTCLPGPFACNCQLKPYPYQHSRVLFAHVIPISPLTARCEMDEHQDGAIYV